MASSNRGHPSFNRRRPCCVALVARPPVSRLSLRCIFPGKKGYSVPRAAGYHKNESRISSARRPRAPEQSGPLSCRRRKCASADSLPEQVGRTFLSAMFDRQECLSHFVGGNGGTAGHSLSPGTSQDSRSGVAQSFQQSKAVPIFVSSLCFKAGRDSPQQVAREKWREGPTTPRWKTFDFSRHGIWN